jgi:hypothetical protein
MYVFSLYRLRTLLGELPCVARDLVTLLLFAVKVASKYSHPTGSGNKLPFSPKYESRSNTFISTAAAPHILHPSTYPVFHHGCASVRRLDSCTSTRLTGVHTSALDCTYLSRCPSVIYIYSSSLLCLGLSKSWHLLSTLSDRRKRDGQEKDRDTSINGMSLSLGHSTLHPHDLTPSPSSSSRVHPRLPHGRLHDTADTT